MGPLRDVVGPLGLEGSGDVWYPADQDTFPPKPLALAGHKKASTRAPKLEAPTSVTASIPG